MIVRTKTIKINLTVVIEKILTQKKMSHGHTETEEAIVKSAKIDIGDKVVTTATIETDTIVIDIID